MYSFMLDLLEGFWVILDSDIPAMSKNVKCLSPKHMNKHSPLIFA